MVLTNWSLTTEVFSLVVSIILLFNYRGRKWHYSRKSKFYLVCLSTTIVSIILNILCVHSIENAAGYLPRWFHMLINSGYFVLILFMVTVVACYLLEIIYEHIYEQRWMQRIRRVFIGITAAYMALVVSNPVTGFLFWFDAENHYLRGPLNRVGYYLMAVEVLIILGCALLNWKHLNDSARQVIRTLPPAVILLTIFQLLYPDNLLNGGIMVITDIIMLFNFQSHRIEVDSLTGLGNRGCLYQQMERRIRLQSYFQVIVVSLSRFNLINQHYGAKNGDAFLYEVGRWMDELSPEGQVYRMGNVEFCVLFSYRNEEQAEFWVKAVQQRFLQPWVVGEIKVVLPVRCAEVVYQGEQWNCSNIFEFINYSLRHTSGKDGLVRFDQKLFACWNRDREVLSLLRQAVRDNRLEVWYQPLYDCKTGRYNSAEALIRMRDHDGNLISPSVFIPLAEENGLVDELTWFVLEEICRFLGGERYGIESVSLNMSAQQFVSSDLIQRIEDCLRRYQVQPQRLKIEITERVLSEDVERMCAIINRLRDMGVCFYLDDFGTGYSNLSSLLGIPISCVKLDRSIISGYPHDKHSCIMVKTIVHLFHQMGCRIVAEGVEDELAARQLRLVGVDWIQGFYYAKPMPVDMFTAFLSQKLNFSDSDNKC